MPEQFWHIKFRTAKSQFYMPEHFSLFAVLVSMTESVTFKILEKMETLEKNEKKSPEEHDKSVNIWFKFLKFIENNYYIQSIKKTVKIYSKKLFNIQAYKKEILYFYNQTNNVNS